MRKMQMRKGIRLVALLLALLMLAACSSVPAETTAGTDPATEPSQAPAAQLFAEQADADHLDKLYEGRIAYHGELHDHAATGGKSDGHKTLTEWKEGLDAFFMDFAAILDHKQVIHMYLPEWDDSIFIGGTEAATTLTNSKAKDPSLHYNMTFADPKGLEAVLNAFPEFQFDGELFAKYPRFSVEKFQELIAAVKQNGGFFSNVHPKQTMVSDDPLDYWFADGTGIEVFYQEMDNAKSEENYKLWTDLLALGKRVYATAGGDGHRSPDCYALTTIYSEKQSAASYLEHVRNGDFICGSVGIRMCIGDTKMGGQCDFEGKKVIFAVENYHEYVRNSKHTYRVDLISDKGVVMSREISCDTPAYFAVDAEDCEFYRVEVTNVTRGYRIAIGNPIWNN